MFANSGEITAPCGVPTLVSLRRPPSDTPAFNHFWISRSILVLPVMEKQGRWVRHPKLDQLHQLFMVDVVEEAANVGVQYPVHLLPHDPRRQSVQRIVRAFARPEAVGKAHEVLLVDCFQHRLGRLLDNLVSSAVTPNGRCRPSALSRYTLRTGHHFGIAAHAGCAR